MKSIFNQILDQVVLMESLYGDFDNWSKSDEVFDKICELEKGLPIGVHKGKVCAWGVADGYAFYIVTEVGKDVCKLRHIPYGDGYRSPCVTESGKAFTETVELSIRRRDGWKQIVSKNK